MIHDKRSEEPGVVIKNWRSDEELAEWRFTISDQKSQELWSGTGRVLGVLSYESLRAMIRNWHGSGDRKRFVVLSEKSQTIQSSLLTQQRTNKIHEIISPTNSLYSSWTNFTNSLYSSWTNFTNSLYSSWTPITHERPIFSRLPSLFTSEQTLRKNSFFCETLFKSE